MCTVYFAGVKFHELLEKSSQKNFMVLHVISWCKINVQCHRAQTYDAYIFPSAVKERYETQFFPIMPGNTSQESFQNAYAGIYNEKCQGRKIS